MPKPGHASNTPRRSMVNHSESQPVMEPTVKAASSKQRLEYTVQPWVNGLVLMGAANGLLRALDCGDCEMQLTQSMVAYFGDDWTVIASDWAPTMPGLSASSNPNHVVFEDIYQALMRPTGKMINVAGDFRIGL